MVTRNSASWQQKRTPSHFLQSIVPDVKINNFAQIAMETIATGPFFRVTLCRKVPKFCALSIINTLSFQWPLHSVVINCLAQCTHKKKCVADDKTGHTARALPECSSENDVRLLDDSNPGWEMSVMTVSITSMDACPRCNSHSPLSNINQPVLMLLCKI